MDEPQSKSDAEAKRKPATRAFPKNRLKEALRIAQSIQDNNAGQPYNRLDLAQSLEYSPGSSTFRTLIISSGRYGLTEGGYIAEKIALTELGKSIVAPRSDEERNKGLLNALESVELFKKFFEKFDQAKLPPDNLLKNTLVRDYGIPQEDVDACLDIIMQNLRDWGLLVDYKGNIWLRTDKLSVEKAIEEIMPSEEEEEEGHPPLPKKEENPPVEVLVPRVFISHSKNETILDQIKTLLDFGQFQYVIAEEMETTSIPIPDKVFGLMRECNSAIINVSADEREKNPEGSYRVNPNVLIEIGGAFLAYNKRVILLTDKRVTLPSNLQGLYRCEYEGDELSFSTAMKLQKMLTSFRELL